MTDNMFSVPIPQLQYDSSEVGITDVSSPDVITTHCHLYRSRPRLLVVPTANPGAMDTQRVYVLLTSILPRTIPVTDLRRAHLLETQ
jgi:hypothetical protein